MRLPVCCPSSLELIGICPHTQPHPEEPRLARRVEGSPRTPALVADHSRLAASRRAPLATTAKPLRADDGWVWRPATATPAYETSCTGPARRRATGCSVAASPARRIRRTGPRRDRSPSPGGQL